MSLNLNPIDISVDSVLTDLTTILNPLVPVVVTVPVFTQEEIDNGLNGKLYHIRNSSLVNNLTLVLNGNIIKVVFPGLRAKFIVRPDNTFKLYNY